MGRMPTTHRLIAATAASLCLTACTVHKQETPNLTGPSALGKSLAVTVSPDVIQQDGASQSVVQITATDNNGQPLRNASMRLEIVVDNFLTDFGRLSARSVVTDSSGRASAIYTAPPPVLGITSDVVVQILVTPSESDFANATPRSVSIRVTPTGIIGAPTSPFVPDFTPPSPTVGNPATFLASFTGSSSSGQVITFVWDFGDGQTAVGQSVQHTFSRPGTFLVTLALIDTLGRTNSVSKSVVVGQGALPVADIVFSPTQPGVDQTINFNGSGSTAEAGHRVTGYEWNFGDGSFGGGVFEQHAYHTAGTYNVTLKVTDDVGRTSALKQVAVTVAGAGGGGGAVANFTISPTNPAVNTLVSFNASGSTAPPGATIVNYIWLFTPGGSAQGQFQSRSFATAGQVTVTLTVVDSLGNTNTMTQAFTVSP